MKTKLIFPLIVLAFGVFLACDKVEGPFIETIGNGPDTLQKVRKILLEDYTGHNCPNCPGAALVAHDLKDIYGSRLIVMTVHAGYFAEPDGGNYTADYRTPAGDEFDTYFGISAVGNPNGMVNRIPYNGNQIIGETNWGSAVAAQVSLPQEAHIELTSSYNASSRQLDVSAEVEFLVDFNGTYKISLMILEDSIVSAQKNSDPQVGATPDILDYVHRHVLRGAINGTWGDTIASGSIIAGDKFNKTFPSYTLNANWNEDKCYILAYIYDMSNNAILQAEEKHVK